MKTTDQINSKEKIRTRDELAEICRTLRENGHTIGFTSGNFDLLHEGHAWYLEEARRQCSVLIVGVNSDSGIRLYKDPRRPVMPEQSRISLLCRLSSVDYTFLFDERRNKENILCLKPHIYFKAGDYQISQLTSAQYMEQWGGKAVLINSIPGISTSTIINSIIEKYADTVPVCTHTISREAPSRAVFLDRDGVINKEIEYLHEEDKFEILPGVLDGLKLLQQSGFKIIIVTNQAGIGLGYFTKEDFFRVNKKMLSVFNANQISIDKIYYCPHGVTDNCICRKPKNGMLLRAQKEYNIDMKKSFIIGDRDSDMQAGKLSDCTAILVQSGHSELSAAADVRVENLYSAAVWICNHL